MYESICDERVLDSPISIRSKSCDSQTSVRQVRVVMKLVILVNLMMSYYWAGSINTAVIDACEIAEYFVQPGNSDLPSASHSSSIDVTKDPSDIAQTPAFPPVRPSINRFPTTMLGSKARSFNPL